MRRELFVRKELKIGLLLWAVSLTLNCFTIVPHFLLGILFGVAICFEIIGSMPEKVYQKIKTWKGILLKIR